VVSRARRQGRRANRPEIERALALLLEPGDVVPLWIPEGARRLGGFYDDPALLARDAEAWSGRTPCVCVTLNPMDPGVWAGPRNQLRPVDASRDAWDVWDAGCLRRRWLLVDVDPRRVPGTSSTEGEHAAALACARRLRAWLATLGWPAPVLADSGNGSHLLYRLDLPNSAAAHGLVDRALGALELRFGDPAVAIDASVGNAARSGKVYGTLAAKGPDLPARPHRLSRLLEVPPVLHPVSEELLAALPRTPPP
jgi:hypothetical protein